ncbi:YiiX/YebB-like N1pC/P60 family cysteine hydrolase [Mangrovibacter plantisponsor]|uniref:Permuted papain-like amidase YaeF/Yiix C92 family enzyme n=1 Tax=Mangrovibacter plantisponsor TaxID=451513 RepID=A0A317PUF5_9ENTR|nr:YiiX/YebB-like N1pC/P60 family cysteine hydrolase [Mangrovibacter plantisponsor]PWW05886.1 permuted papain-like amidase YaeF/Yiix C92 family enzyme [Mangrovibacter plantisponsor]
MRKKLYIIQQEKLEIGDVIFTSEKSFISWFVRLVTFSRFSHVMLHVNGTTIHSVSGGVYSQNLQRLLFKKRYEVKVFRPIDKLTIAEESKICEYARNKVLSVYALLETIYVVIPFTSTASKKQFCSRLVAQSYKAAGKIIVKDPNYCSPKQIMKSGFFYEVDDCIKIASEKEIAFSKKFNPIQLIENSTISMIKKIRLSYGEKIQTIHDIIKLLIIHPEADDFVTLLAHDFGYFEHAQFDLKINPWRYSIKEFLNYVDLLGLNNNQIDSLAHRIYYVGDETANVHANEFYLYSVLHKKYKLNFFYESMELYKRLIRTDDIRKGVAISILSRLRT